MLGQNLLDLVSSTRRAPKIPTFAIALAVTAIVALPLLFRALDPVPIDTGPAADSDGLVLAFGPEDTKPLDEQIVTGSIRISFRDPIATAVSFSLFERGSSDPVFATQDLDGPQFDLIRDAAGNPEPLDSTELGDGSYELFITVDTPAGEKRTAVTFLVQNS